MQKCSNIVFMQKNCLIQQSLILFDFYDCSILIYQKYLGIGDFYVRNYTSIRTISLL
jgi:hypothetical protein